MEARVDLSILDTRWSESRTFWDFPQARDLHDMGREAVSQSLIRRRQGKGKSKTGRGKSSNEPGHLPGSIFDAWMPVVPVMQRLRTAPRFSRAGRCELAAREWDTQVLRSSLFRLRTHLRVVLHFFPVLLCL